MNEKQKKELRHTQEMKEILSTLNDWFDACESHIKEFPITAASTKKSK